MTVYRTGFIVRFSTPVLVMSPSSIDTRVSQSNCKIPKDRRVIIKRLEALDEVDLVRMDFLEQDPEIKWCIDFVFTFRKMNKAFKKIFTECNIF